MADQKSFDCKMRQLAVDFAEKLQPFRSGMNFQQVGFFLLKNNIFFKTNHVLEFPTESLRLLMD